MQSEFKPSLGNLVRTHLKKYLSHMQTPDLAASVRKKKKKVVEGPACLGTQLVSSKLRSKDYEPAFKATNGKQAPEKYKQVHRAIGKARHIFSHLLLA